MAFLRQRYQTASDDDLPRLFLNGNRNKVLGEIYNRFGHLMFGTCLKYLKNKQDAEDCVMELFEALPQKLEKYEVKHLKSWLYRTTQNACLMRLRKNNPTSNAIHELEEKLHSIEGGKEEKELLEVKIDALKEAINSLKEEQKEAIKLFYLASKSYQEISEELGLPIKKVKSVIQNGKRNIKLKLEDHVSFKSA